MTLNRFIGKTVLMTGAGTGMGRAAARRLVEEGAKVALIGRRPDTINQLREEIEATGGESVALACDIADGKAVRVAVKTTRDHFGRLDALFANSGVLGDFKPLAATETRDFDGLIGTNLLGTILTIKQGLPFSEGGRVLVNASWTEVGVMPGAGACAATKGAKLKPIFPSAA